MVQPFEHPDAIEVGEIQIEPARQHQGLGSRLLRDGLARAICLYERLGSRHLEPTATHARKEAGGGAPGGAG